MGNANEEEPIIDPDLAIVDSLHHLFVRPGQRYLLDDYLADATAGHRIVASVYMQAGAFLRRDGPAAMRGLGEVEFANGMGAMAASGDLGPVQACAAIVGNVDLRLGDGVARFLDDAQARAPERFRGVRQGANHSTAPEVMRLMPDPPPAGLLADGQFRAGLAHLAARNLVFDTAVFHHQLGEVADLADAFPGTTIVLNHAGLALGIGQDQAGRAAIFADWRRGLRDLAARPNVFCRISGLGLPFWGFGFDQREQPARAQELVAAWQPYVHEAIEAFGADRCMMGSNYPPDSASAGFVPLWNALKLCTAGASAQDRHALFCGTAARIYRINQTTLVKE